jgi:hypothetical protein
MVHNLSQSNPYQRSTPSVVCNERQLPPHCAVAQSVAAPGPRLQRTTAAAALLPAAGAPGVPSAQVYFFPPYLHAYQKAVRQDHQRHMVVPSTPGAHFIITHPQPLLARFKEDYNTIENSRCSTGFWCESLVCTQKIGS